MVRLRELGCVDAPGFAAANELTVTLGRPPAIAAVMPIRTTCALTWAAVRLKRNVVGLLPSFHRPADNAEAALPMVNVTGPQLPLRASDGCISDRLPPLRSSSGAPSHSPIFQIVAGLARVDAMFCPVSAVLAVTVTVRVATSSSRWYSVC